MRELWLKDDTRNPTGSFKDRVVSVALSSARRLGFSTAACASTGNLATSVAAHAASIGWPSVTIIPADLERSKIAMTAIFGGTVLGVEGSYDDVNRLCVELVAEHPEWAFANVNVRPYYAEGSKTLAYEIAEQLGWRAPDQVVVPVASGSQLTKVAKGFKELSALGLVDGRAPVLYGAQAAGCSPIATAFADGADVVTPQKPNTIARSLAIGNPADGPYVLDELRRDGGRLRVGRRRRDPRVHLAAGRDRGHLRRDRRRGDRGLAAPDARARDPGSATPDRGHHLGPRSQDPRRRRGDRHPHRDGGADARGRRGGPALRPAGGGVVSVLVRLPSQLRPLAGGAGEVPVEASTVREAIVALDAAYPGVALRVLDDRGASFGASSTCSWPTRTSGSSRGSTRRWPRARPSRWCRRWPGAEPPVSTRHPRLLILPRT